jgi:hypothetical protein
MLLSKWYGKGMGKELNQFIQLLEAADRSKTIDQVGILLFFEVSFKKAKIFFLKKYNGYALLIQKTWRGYISRKRLKKIHSAISKFQKSIRMKSEMKKEYKDKEAERNELSFQLAIEHRRKLRQNKLNMAELLQILPASQIEKYLEKQRIDAATKIQATYRGHRYRKKFNNEKYLIVCTKAAVCIQRTVKNKV